MRKIAKSIMKSLKKLIDDSYLAYIGLTFLITIVKSIAFRIYKEMRKEGLVIEV